MSCHVPSCPCRVFAVCDAHAFNHVRTPVFISLLFLQVHVGLSGDDSVILEYELEGEGPHEQGWLRDGHEALR